MLVYAKQECDLEAFVFLPFPEMTVVERAALAWFQMGSSSA